MQRPDAWQCSAWLPALTWAGGASAAEMSPPAARQSQVTQQCLQHFAAPCSGSAELRCRGLGHSDARAAGSLHFKAYRAIPLPLTDERLWLRAQGYAMKLMEEVRPWNIAQFPSLVITDPSEQQHTWAQQDTWGRKRQRSAASSPLSLPKAELCWRTCWTIPCTTTRLALFTCQLEGDTSFRGQNS